jgi:hypothetical protein
MKKGIAKGEEVNLRVPRRASRALYHGPSAWRRRDGRLTAPSSDAIMSIIRSALRALPRTPAARARSFGASAARREHFLDADAEVRRRLRGRPRA